MAKRSRPSRTKPDARAFQRKLGRPVGAGIKLTPEVQALILAHLRAGNYLETAAQAAGVDKTTLYDWLKKGAAGRAPYATFSHAVVDAQAQAEARDLQRMDDHGRLNWQAVAWRLERRHPDRWARRERLDVQHDGALTLKVTFE